MVSLYIFMQAFADENRLRIISLLNHSKMCVCELSHILHVSQPAVSKHLKKLRNAGLIQSKQEGLWTNYSLAEINDPCLSNILHNALLYSKKNTQTVEDIHQANIIDRKDLCNI